MIFAPIRSRMLAAVLVPITLSIVAIVAVFWVGRLADLDEAHEQRAHLLARQVAMASEYALFSGNVTSLQGLLQGVARESDVRSVAIFDAQGTLLISAGAPMHTRLKDLHSPTFQQHQRSLLVDTVSEAITPNTVPLDDIYTPAKDAGMSLPQVLGHVVVELSREALGHRERELLWVALWVGAAGVMVGGVLAVMLGRGVVEPIMNVSRRMERIGAGDFSAPTQIPANDPLRDLHIRIDQMATQLAWGRDELEHRIAVATQALRLKKEEAETATLAKSRFLAAASHDLRQPTHALGMFVARLGQLPLDDQASQLVASLEASVQAMQDLLDGLLDLSRLDAGAVQVNLRPTEMEGLFAALRSAMEPIAHSKGLRLRVRSTTRWAQTDPVLLQSILLNLVQNALRYTDKGSVLVACRTAQNGHALRIEVRDSGVGISKEHQAQVFREFFQVGNSGRDRSRGMGLGLNIVERTARLLQHPITLKSDVGCGTCFIITVPAIARPVTVPMAAPPDNVNQLGLEGTRVLLVEDDGFALEAVSELLRSWGCEVFAADQVEQACVWVRDGLVPDVLMSDYRLGGQSNGLDAIAQLRALAQRDIPACLMSGDTDAELMQSAKLAGLPLLHKPVRPAKLKNLLRRMTAAVSPSHEDVS
jgi:two-component system, sensor histidine kinase